MAISLLNLDAFVTASIATEPFSFVVVPGFIRPAALRMINADYPDISQPGSFPVGQLSYGPAFRAFIGELESVEFRKAFEEKFKIDLSGRPATVTVRGRCSAKDR
jgi:SM-20-related protein